MKNWNKVNEYKVKYKIIYIDMIIILSFSLNQRLGKNAS